MLKLLFQMPSDVEIKAGKNVQYVTDRELYHNTLNYVGNNDRMM
jgi:hypothetical protein